MMTSANQSLINYRKSFNKGNGNMRKSDCILNDGTTISLNLDSRENAKKKNNNNRKKGSETPLKSSYQ